MKRKRKFSFASTIKSRLIISFVLILLIPSLVIGYTSYQAAKLKVDEQMTNTARENVVLLDNTINQFLDAKMKSVDYFSNQINGGLIAGEANGGFVS